MDPGKLNRQVTIKSRTAARNAIGEVETGWATHRQAWANIRNLRGTEAIRSDRPVSEVTTSIRLRYCTDLNAGMRIEAGGVVYEIEAVLPDEGQRQWTDLACKVVR